MPTTIDSGGGRDTIILGRGHNDVTINRQGNEGSVTVVGGGARDKIVYNRTEGDGRPIHAPGQNLVIIGDVDASMVPGTVDPNSKPPETIFSVFPPDVLIVIVVGCLILTAVIFRKSFRSR